MGSVCSTCTLFDDPDVRDRIHNTESRNLIHYPDPTQNAPATPATDQQSGYNYNNTQTQKKSSVADRRSIFESNDKATKKNKKPKPTTKKSMNKPKKKWTVKGIDYKKKNSKKAINASSNIQSNIINDDDEEPSMSISHKDRMKLYEEDVANVEQKEKERTQQYKEQRGGYSGVTVSSQQKEMAKKLLEQRVETQKKGDLNGITLSGDGTGDIVLKSDDVDNKNGDVLDGQMVNKKKKKRTMNELLKEATKDDARNITLGMGLIQNEYDNKEKRDIYILNMNNNNIMSRLTDEQKKKLIYLIGHSIVDINGKDKIERVTMCNTGIDDKLMMELMRVLVENKDCCIMQELWMESNRIGDDGMNGLCHLIECNIDSLRVIKLYNNKKDVSTSCCNKMIDALESNNKIIKFTFEWRLQHQRDRVEKLLKKNQELRRKSKVNK